MFMTVIYAGDMTLNLREKKHKNFQNKAVYNSDFEINFSLNVSEKSKIASVPYKFIDSKKKNNLSSKILHTSINLRAWNETSIRIFN